MCTSITTTLFRDGSGILQQDNVTLPHGRNGFTLVWETQQWGFIVYLAFKIPWPQSNRAFVVYVFDKLFWPMETHFTIYGALIIWLLMAWWCILQHTFGGLEESISWWVRAVLAAKKTLRNIRRVLIMLWLIVICFFKSGKLYCGMYVNCTVTHLVGSTHEVYVNV